jgi:hypothetical protein
MTMASVWRIMTIRNGHWKEATGNIEIIAAARTKTTADLHDLESRSDTDGTRAKVQQTATQAGEITTTSKHLIEIVGARRIMIMMTRLLKVEAKGNATDLDHDLPLPTIAVAITTDQEAAGDIALLP